MTCFGNTTTTWSSFPFKDFLDEGNLPKRPSALLLTLSEHLVPVRFASVSDSRLAGWIAKHFEHSGVSADRDVCNFIIAYCGKNMTELALEVEKAAHYVLSQGKNRVTTDDIRFVCVASLDADAFLLANSILDSKHSEALRAVEVMKYRRIEPIFVLSEVSRVIGDLLCVKVMSDGGKTFTDIVRLLKMNEYKAKLYLSRVSGKSHDKLKKAVDLCSEADMSIKLGANGYLVLEKLICSL